MRDWSWSDWFWIIVLALIGFSIQREAHEMHVRECMRYGKGRGVCEKIATQDQSDWRSVSGFDE